ncbi:tellurium resistance protein [Rhodobacter sp. Har01]|uniref:SLAC1 family transporter n=1 Tax=Rhodobacter sp. Har01 TaxID=2883999 RepID=UPI001D07C423|nr:tellurium resistance protein [Rhodobacter sp. Har01]MCB6177239.1 tellurium resistance protein [Rhodobacter sp. Har01]
MANDPVNFRPKAYPPPEFPPRKAPAFARTPPAVFPVILGLLGLALALRAGLARVGLPEGLGDLVAGLVLPVWAFAVLSYGVKLARRPGVILDDLKVMPARAGLAAATMGGMAVAALLAPFAPRVALGMLAISLVAHAGLALLVGRVLAAAPPEGQAVNPGWHLTFVGFIVGGVAAAQLGLPGLARGLLWATLVPAAAIWGVSLVQLIRRVPPAPLRPLLAIHLAPASLFATVAAQTGQEGLALAFGVLALGIFLALALGFRWITEAGFSPLWGAFTFPLAAFVAALIRLGGVWTGAGLGLLVVALVAVPVVAWKVLSLWPGGRLAGKTNAAEA